MMDDHVLLSRVRNDLADALKILLNPNIMTTDDFRQSRDCAVLAIKGLDALLAIDRR